MAETGHKNLTSYAMNYSLPYGQNHRGDGKFVSRFEEMFRCNLFFREKTELHLQKFSSSILD